MRQQDWQSWAHKLVEDVASLQLTPDQDPKYFEEDILLSAVWRLEAKEADWLLGLVRDRSYPLEGRVRIANHMATIRQQALQILRLEDLDLATDDC